MQNLFFLIFLAFSSVDAIPQVISLWKFNNLADFNITGVEAGAQVYLASNDNTNFLKTITLKSGVTSITLDQIYDLNDDGTPKSFPIVSDLIVSTTNDDNTAGRLSGFIYITTKMQTDDPNFSVYVIKTSHVISKTAMKSTVVVLNTELRGAYDGDQPSKTSYVTGIDHSPNTNLYFQWGIPPANWYDVTNNTFFRNPVVLNNDTEIIKAFFDHVEPLQVGLNCWYFTVMGPINMKLENKYVSNHNYTTTAVNTTGIIVNSFIYQTHVVNFIPDLTRSGISGGFDSAFIYPDDYLGIFLDTVTGRIGNELNGTSEGQNSFYTYEQASKLSVISKTMAPGDFYVQYFTFAGDLLPVTSTTPATSVSTTVGKTTSAVSTSTVRTTTQGGSSLFRIEILAILLTVFMYFK